MKWLFTQMISTILRHGTYWGLGLTSRGKIQRTFIREHYRASRGRIPHLCITAGGLPILSTHLSFFRSDSPTKPMSKHSGMTGSLSARWSTSGSRFTANIITSSIPTAYGTRGFQDFNSMPTAPCSRKQTFQPRPTQAQSRSRLTGRISRSTGMIFSTLPSTTPVHQAANSAFADISAIGGAAHGHGSDSLTAGETIPCTS